MITFTYKSCTKQDFERFENIFVENKNNSPIRHSPRQPYWPPVIDDVCVHPRILYPLHCTHYLLLLCAISKELLYDDSALPLHFPMERLQS